MSAAKSPRSLCVLLIAALAAVLVIAGCGGAGGKVVSGQTPPATGTPGTVEPQGTGGESATSEEGEAGEEGTSEGGEAAAEGEAGGAEAEGGAGESSESAGAGSEGESEGAEEGGESAGGATAAAEGMTVFTSNCGTCHTLAAAGTNGNIGPNLDELMPSESIVETQVTNGGGAMPAFGKEGILSPEEVKAVAAYVSSEAGK